MKTIRVLLVDDSEEFLAGLAQPLQAAGLQVTLARNGNEALTRLDQESPEIIISDVMMPGLNGYELCRQVRARGTDTPFVFLSSLGSPPERKIGLRMGADDYMVKPVDWRVLLAKIESQLLKCRKQRELRELFDEP